MYIYIYIHIRISLYMHIYIYMIYVCIHAYDIHTHHIYTQIHRADLGHPLVADDKYQGEEEIAADRTWRRGGERACVAGERRCCVCQGDV